jgi:serine/threonine protein kinase
MTTAYQSIGKYRILGEIASGSFGRVYHGEDTSRQNYPVAIKLMHAAHLANASERNSYLQEARLLTMLHHPLIVPVLDVGIENEFPYLVMEYAPNGSLYDRLKQQTPRPLSIKEAQKILGQVGAALQYAHQQNVIHRDLKPANILFNAQGDALLADFGIATMLATSIQSGTAVGTPYYMAPEQFRGTISKEGDQYALGCIAYQIMTGRLPFDAPDFFALGYKHMSENAIPPTQLNLLIPYPVEGAIMKAMAKQRTDRFGDVLAFVNALGAPIPTFAPASSSATFLPTLPPTPATVAEETLPPTPPIMRSHEEEDKEDHTLKRTRYIEEEELDTSADQSVIFPLRQVVQEEEGLPAPVGRGAARSAAPHVGAEEVESGQPFAPVDALPRLLDVSDQATVQPDVLPRIVEGPVAGTASPGGIRRAGKYGDDDEAEAVDRSTHGDDDDDAGPGKSLEGDDDGPGYLAGAGTLVGAGGPTSWSMGTQTNPAGGAQKKRKRRGIILIAATIALLFILVGGGVLYAMTGIIRRPPPKPKPPALATALVTITPTRAAVAKTYTIDAITGAPNAAKNQVQARYISASEGTQSKTITATGQGTTPATKASGDVTFTDHTSQYEYMVPQGYPLATGNGLTAIVSEGFNIYPGQSKTVGAYISTTGSNGNIPAYSIQFNYQSGSLTATNTAPFSGGSNGSSYTYVSQADMNNASSAGSQMQAQEESGGQAAVTAQVRSNERMMGGVGCSPDKTYNHGAGDHASSVTVSVSVSCSAEVYDQQEAQALASTLLENAIKATPNEAPLGQPTTSVIGVTGGSNGTVILKVVATGTEIATFTTAQKQLLATLIAGSTASEAQDILVNQTGVGKAVVVVHGSNGHTLPKDTARITVVVAQP